MNGSFHLLPEKQDSGSLQIFNSWQISQQFKKPFCEPKSTSHANTKQNKKTHVQAKFSPTVTFGLWLPEK